MTKIRLPTLGLTLLALAGCATNPGSSTVAAGPSDCFETASIANYAVQDRETVNLRVGAAYYQVKLLGICTDIDWSQGLAFQTAGSGSVCTGNDITVGYQGRTGPQECAGDSVRRLSQSEVAALPGSARP
jgi:hypothetical protein